VAPVTASLQHAPSPQPAAMPSPPTTFPAQTTPFVGRRHELAELLRRLRDPDCRLLTLVGPGGIGKTRLAIEAAQVFLATDENTLDATVDVAGMPAARQPTFKDGSFFVPLQPVESSSGVVSAIAAALGLQFYSSAPPQQQLLQFLHEKELLLVLDNFEHLLAATDLVAEILAAAPKVQLLVTSREALKLQEEWFHPLTGMRLPPAQQVHTPKDNAGSIQQMIADYDSVQLFVQTARRALVAFEPEQEQEHIIRICRLLDGTPLAIELAASWLKVISCAQISHEIERGIDILVARHQNVPARHRSMRAVLEQTWALLGAQEQAILKRLSVFRGGFRLQAAEQVAGASLLLLAQLVEKALVRPASNGHYQMHELIRQFGAEQLQSVADEQQQAQANHCAYYLSLIQQQTVNFKGKQHQEAFAEIATNLDNLRAAWDYAATKKDAKALDSAAEGLWIFSDSRGMFQEAEAAFRQAVELLTEQSAGVKLREKEMALIGFLRAGQGYLCNRRGNIEQGRTLMEDGIKLLRQVEHFAKRKMAIALLYFGWLRASQFEVEQAKQVAQESMSLFTDFNDHWGRTACMELLSVAAKNAGQLAEAEQISQEGLAQSTEIKAYKLRGGFLQKLGDIATWLGEYGHAQKHLSEALEIAMRVGSLPSITQVQRDLARLALFQGNYAYAAQMLEEGLILLQECGYPWETRVLPVLGAAHHLCGDDAQAERCYQECLHIARASGNQAAIASCLTGLGIVALDRGDPGLAEPLQQEALTLWRELALEPEIAVVYGHLGHVLASAGEKRMWEAKYYYLQALQLALKHRLAPLALDVFAGLSHLLASRGEFQRVYELLTLAEHHDASMAETKQRARTLWQKLSVYSSTMTITQAHSIVPLPDWRLIAQKLVEELPGIDPDSSEVGHFYIAPSKGILRGQLQEQTEQGGAGAELALDVTATAIEQGSDER
jgi:predicted ATPase